MPTLKKFGLLLAGLLLVAQVVPLSRTNPPVESEIATSPEVRQILKRACFDCHSNETVWPWYSYVAPVSWVVVHHVNDGREHLNLSTWGRVPPSRQTELVKKIQEEVSEGKMPLAGYLPAHPEARLTDADKAALDAWATALAR